MDLNQYNFPEDLKNMSLNDLDMLSYQIRDFLIEKVSHTGGHIASNLGVVELTIALHRAFDSPKDKIVWDVGHQSYVHKILTGRAEGFDSLRQFKGMSGFPKAKESDHDIFDTGHSSTSISVAAGIAAGRDLKHEKFNVIAVIGDGSMTGGMAFEALNNVGAQKTQLTVILNDNGMSISKNIGGLSQHLNKLRASSGYQNMKASLRKTLHQIPVVGETIFTGMRSAKDRVKYALISGGVIFEELGFTYLGPVDGHNIGSLLEVIESSKQVKGPVLIHVITKKGKGYRNAELQPNKFHGIGPFDSETGNPIKAPVITYSQVLGDALSKAGERDSNIVAVSAAMTEATGLGTFAKRFPSRTFDVGIAEQHAVTFAAGLAKEGLKPCVAIYSSFLQRAYDQIVEDVCLQNLPVVFAVDRAGNVGSDGETHHGLLDLSFLSSIPNMTVLTPKDGNQLEKMLYYAFSLNKPCAIRYPRGKCGYDMAGAPDFDGLNVRTYDAGKVDIWAVGRMHSVALDIRDILEARGVSCGVVDVTTVKPLDMSLLDRKTNLIVTLEDNVMTGGFGQTFTAVSGLSNVLTFGWPDRFIEHGNVDELMAEYKLDASSVAERICAYLGR